MNKKIIELILKNIENMKQGVSAFSYRDVLGDGTVMLIIAVDDIDFYFSEEFKKFKKKQYANFSKIIGEKFVFVYQNPKEELINRLYNEGNLIVNI